MRLLIVEDDPGLSSMLRRAMSRRGWVVDVAENGQDARWAAAEGGYDAVVMDVTIPAPDGLEVLRGLRAAGCWTPVLLLTARDRLEHRVAGLDAGADDYLTKPFEIDELAARLRSLVRRAPAPRPTVLRRGDLELDPAARTVRRGGVDVVLSAKEFDLLADLLRHAGHARTRSQLLDAVWDSAYASEGAGSNVVDVYVRYLREKVDRPFGRRDITTVRGVGYRFDG